MKRKDAFDKYMDVTYKKGFDDGHRIALLSLIFGCGIMAVWDVINVKKSCKTANELCENYLDNHVYLDEDDEEK